MKTKTFLLLCLLLGIWLTEASAQKGTPYHSYPTKVNDGWGAFWVTCDGVNIDYIECYWDGMDILHLRNGKPAWLKEIAHWKFTSAVTGEEFRVKESVNFVVNFDAGTAEGTDRAILIGDKGSRYKLTLLVHVTPDSFTCDFADIKCF